MARIKTDGKFTAPKPHGPPRIRLAFPGEKFPPGQEPFLVEQQYMQFAADYLRSKESGESESLLGTEWEKFEENKAFDDVSRLNEAKLVEESNIQSLAAGLVQFTRTYATVPPTRHVYESYPWRVPGLIESQIVARFFTIESKTESGSDWILSVPDASAISAPDSNGEGGVTSIRIQYLATSEANNNAWQVRHQLRKIKSRTDSSITVEKIRDAQFSELQLLTPLVDRRDPRTETVSSVVEVEYFLVGTGETPFQAIQADGELEIKDKLEIRDSTGKVTDTISTDTERSVTDWNKMRAGATPLTENLASRTTDTGEPVGVIAEASVIRRWKGPIYEMSTRYVKAQ